VNKALKILHLFDFYLPTTMNWAYALMRHTPGVQQFVAAPWMVRNDYYAPDFQYFLRNFQRLPGFFPKDEGSFSGISNNLIRLERYWPLYKNWLYRQIKNNPPDVLHAHFGPVGCHYMDIAEMLNIPLLTSFYGYDFQRLPFEKPRYQQQYLQLFHQAAAVTTTGPYTVSLLESMGCPSEKIVPVPLGVDLNQFSNYSRTKQPGRLKLVQVATITEKKGHLDTLAALRGALITCPNLHLTFAGEQQDKTLVAKVAAFIQQANLEQHVTWLPAIPHQDLPHFLSQFDVFIHPSKQTANRDNEGAPVVLVEAQACGLPVISTNHADIPTQVEHNRSGLLSPQNDPTALIPSIQRFYQMENDEYQTFSRNAQHHIITHFDVNTSGAKLLQLYNRLVIM
jgi:colanic acid/amylovoran biosynthesis glycosyltransferase